MSSAPWLDGPQDSFPETYVVACPDTQQLQRPVGYECEFPDLFVQRSDTEDIWFWNTFVRPVEGIKRIQRYRPTMNPRRLSPLERLPNELVELVLDCFIEDRLAVLALGLASPILYPNVLACIHRDYAIGRVASWAGKIVGFYGDESPVAPADIPAFEGNGNDYFPWSVDQWWKGWETVSMQPEQQWHESLAEARHHWEHLESARWEDIDQDLSQIYMYTQDQTWVLRNLTTRQVVRSDGLFPPAAILDDELLTPKVRRPRMFEWVRKIYDPTKPGEVPPRVKAMDALSLPQIFLVLTAHSAHPGWRQEDIGFRRGPWVSHAFEVVSLDDHTEDPDSEWRDVTASVAADVGHLRWCAMQHAALSQPDVDALWNRPEDFRVRASEARARWSRWARNESS
ncbi:hypothetical protein IQ06DRAFT_353910 [Phaeosphaeriaceae sp. SRC1lsM3a]|nr:hypothetical protein IQ06DRAFT_353910 [Stagonospora sp. SRC1lsM3a]